MSQLIHEGPTHISVDGTLSNPFVLAAVLIVASAIAVGAYLVLARGPRMAWLAILGIIVVGVMSYGEIYHLLAFELNWLLGGGRVPTTYFGTPPPWAAPLAFAIGTATAILKKVVFKPSSK